MEFEFNDEPSNESSSTVKFGTPNRTPKALSATKKKTTTFNSVMEKLKSKKN
jgi:hypothetical protein